MAGEAVEKLVRTIHTLYQDIELAKGEVRDFAERIDEEWGYGKKWTDGVPSFPRGVERSVDALESAIAPLWDPLAEAELAAEAALREIRQMTALMGGR